MSANRKVLRSYSYLLRRYYKKSTNLLKSKRYPQWLSGWRGGQAAAGLNSILVKQIICYSQLLTLLQIHFVHLNILNNFQFLPELFGEHLSSVVGFNLHLRSWDANSEATAEECD